MSEPVEEWNGFIHFTNAKESGYGRRLPTVYYQRSTAQIEVVFYNDASNRDITNFVKVYTEALQMGQRYDLKIEQFLDTKTNSYQYKIFLNGDKIEQGVSPAPEDWLSARYYIGSFFSFANKVRNSIAIYEFVFFGVTEND